MNKIVSSIIVLLFYINACSCYYYSTTTTTKRSNGITIPSSSIITQINQFNKFKMTSTDNKDASFSSSTSSDNNNNNNNNNNDDNNNNNNIQLENILNMRDIATASPLKISKNKIFRSGCPSRASPSDVQLLLQDYSIQHFLDLRSQKELDEDEHLYSNQIYSNLNDLAYDTIKKSWESDNNNNNNNNNNKRFFISLMNENVVKKGVFFRLRKRERLQALFWTFASISSALLSTAFASQAEKRAKKIFIKYVNEGGLALLNELVIDCSPTLVIEALKQITIDDGPIVFYCTAGKDRTGLLSMLILSILGASDEEIVNDYILSDNAYKAMNDKKAMVASLEQEELNPDVFLTAKAPVMLHTLNYVRDNYGSILSFLDKYGYDDSWCSKLIAKAGI